MPIGSPFNIDVSSGGIMEIPDPAAGAERTFVLQQNYKNELLGLSFTLTNDANAANRYVWIEYVINTITFVAAGAIIPLTANAAVTYFCHPTATFTLAALGNFCPIPIMPFIHFDESDQVVIHVDNIQVGDQLSNIRAAFNIWIYPH